MTPARTILVTHALPYANGELHIGHLLGYIQSDIWVRARRMAGATVHFVSADDAHGTPIMLAAEKAGQQAEEFIRGMQRNHERDFIDFGIVHDYYYTTHSQENRELAESIYRRLRDAQPASHIARRSVRQFYDPLKQMFLPDRYIKGECPNCGTPDQYGDNCENCGATYAPTDLKNPRSVISGATPELRDSEHYFFKVGDFSAMLREWLSGARTGSRAVMHSSVAAKLKEWLDADGGVRDWDISRDAPYFGFAIPDAPGKFFYVWLDAPIGYLASFKKYCSSPAGVANRLDAHSFDRFMHIDAPGFDPSHEMHHFIGKDIVNFHGLFWPAMLEGARLRIPDRLHVNGYLTVNGEKMSKSRGTFVQARTYLDAGLDPEYLRYYFATMLGEAPTDVDLDLQAFEDRVNSHLVGKWANIASRTAAFVHKFFDGALASTLPAVESALLQSAAQRLAACAELYASGDFAGVTRVIMEVADEANAYVAQKAPWKLAKDETQRNALHVVCTMALNYFRLLSIWLRPIVPGVTARAQDFLGEPLSTFAIADKPLLGSRLNEFVPLITRIETAKIDTMIASSKDTLQRADAPASTNPAPVAQNTVPAQASAPGAEISIDEFARLDLRIGKVAQCALVEGSDKLLRFELDAGELGTRQIFSGIRGAYPDPEKLIGRNVVFIANLAPRKMRFGVSQGMILSAGSGGSDLFLLDVDQGAAPGMPVK